MILPMTMMPKEGQILSRQEFFRWKQVGYETSQDAGVNTGTGGVLRCSGGNDHRLVKSGWGKSGAFTERRGRV